MLKRCQIVLLPGNLDKGEFTFAVMTKSPWQRLISDSAASMTKANLYSPSSCTTDLLHYNHRQTPRIQCQQASGQRQIYIRRTAYASMTKANLYSPSSCTTDLLHYNHRQTPRIYCQQASGQRQIYIRRTAYASMTKANLYSPSNCPTDILDYIHRHTPQDLLPVSNLDKGEFTFAVMTKSPWQRLISDSAASMTKANLYPPSNCTTEILDSIHLHTPQDLLPVSNLDKGEFTFAVILYWHTSSSAGGQIDFFTIHLLSVFHLGKAIRRGD